MSIGQEMRRFAHALASTFSLFPQTDYRAAYKRRSAAELVDQAWARTARDFNRAVGTFARHEQER